MPVLKIPNVSPSSGPLENQRTRDVRFSWEHKNTCFVTFSVEFNIEPDKDGFYHIGDMNLTKSQYQEAYALVADSGVRGEESRWKNGSKI